MESYGRIWQELTWSWASSTGNPALDQRLDAAAHAAWPYARLCAWTYLNDQPAAHDIMDHAVENASGYVARHPDFSDKKLLSRIKSVLRRRARQIAAKRSREILYGLFVDMEDLYVVQPEVEQRIYACELFERLSPFAQTIVDWRSMDYSWREIAAKVELDHTSVRRAFNREEVTAPRSLPAWRNVSMSLRSRWFSRAEDRVEAWLTRHHQERVLTRETKPAGPCPDESFLQSLARHSNQIAFTDPRVGHAANCPICMRRLLELRPAYKARRRRMVLTAAAACCCVIVVALILVARHGAKPPVRDPDTLCAISSRNLIKGNDLEPVSVPDFESWRKQNSVFESMAAETGGPVTLNSNGEPEVVVGGRVTPSYFDVIGISPALGRGFLPDESQAGKDHVVILSNALWRDRFASDPGTIGKDIEINGEPYTVVGVTPQLDSSFPRLWVPLGIQAKDLTPDARGHYDLARVLGRLRPGVTVTKAQAEMTSIAENLTRAYPVTNNGRGITVLTIQDYNIRSQGARNGVIVLMTVASFVLLIACANIAGMLLARGAARVHEMAVRAAVGAARLRLIRQMLAESLLIGAAGGGAGLLGSVFGIKLLRAAFAFNDFGKRVGEGLRLDVPTLFFTLTVSLLTTLLFGLMPAIRASKANPRDALTDRSPTSSAGFGRIRMRSALVAGQIALAFVLLAGAGVMMRDTIREYSEPNGFNPDHVLAAQIALTGPNDQDPARQAGFFKQLIEKVREIPGVESADANTCLPLGCRWSMPFSVVGEPHLPDSQRPWADYFATGTEYFHTMQIPLMRGRGFMDSDNVKAPIVALVNVEFARRFFPGGDAIGHEIEIGQQERKQARIVGIVGNVNEFQGQLSPRPQIYEHFLQAPSPGMAIVLRSSIEPKALAPMLQRAIGAANRDKTASRIWTMRDLVDDNAGGDRLMVELLGVFACLALLLSAVGIYGVIAYSVTQRTREIGIRVALGAHKGNVLSLVLRQGAMLSAIGCTIGLLLALPLPRVFSAVFNSFAPQGPMVAMAVGLIVPTVSMLATFIPARRASSLDPMRALRTE